MISGLVAGAFVVDRLVGICGLRVSGLVDSLAFHSLVKISPLRSLLFFCSLEVHLLLVTRDADDGTLDLEIANVWEYDCPDLLNVESNGRGERTS